MMSDGRIKVTMIPLDADVNENDEIVTSHISDKSLQYRADHDSSIHLETEFKKRPCLSASEFFLARGRAGEGEK